MNITGLKILRSAVLVLAVIVIMSSSSQGLAATSLPAPSGTVSETVKGEVIMAGDQVLVVKDGAGKGVLVQVSKVTQFDSTVKVGDKVEAQLSRDGQALSVKKAQ
ncbi:MAG: hypothetical protein ACREQA_02105 [Candidatus Binatia bacterium]